MFSAMFKKLALVTVAGSAALLAGCTPAKKTQTAQAGDGKTCPVVMCSACDGMWMSRTVAVQGPGKARTEVVGYRTTKELCPDCTTAAQTALAGGKLPESCASCKGTMTMATMNCPTQGHCAACEAGEKK